MQYNYNIHETPSSNQLFIMQVTHNFKTNYSAWFSRYSVLFLKFRLYNYRIPWPWNWPLSTIVYILLQMINLLHSDIDNGWHTCCTEGQSTILCSPFHISEGCCWCHLPTGGNWPCHRTINGHLECQLHRFKMNLTHCFLFEFSIQMLCNSPMHLFYSSILSNW